MIALTTNMGLRAAIAGGCIGSACQLLRPKSYGAMLAALLLSIAWTMAAVQ